MGWKEGSFSRPGLYSTTRLACSSNPRCCVTACRDIASPLMPARSRSALNGLQILVAPAGRLDHKTSSSDFLEGPVACFHHAGCGKCTDDAYPREHQKNGVNASCIDHEAHKRGSRRRRDS